MRSEAGIITSSLSTSLKSTCVILIYDLAQAKSEALVNIYSLLKQNIKSCNANQAATATKTAKKKGLFSKTKNFARAAHFFLYFYAVVLYDDNVELPETSWVHVLWRKCCLRSCLLFFRCRSFLPWWPLAVSHFLTAAVKFSCYSSNEIGLLCLFISGSSSFSVIHANVDFKIKWKDWESASLLLLFLSLKVRVAILRFTAEMRVYLKCKISTRFTWRGGRT